MGSQRDAALRGRAVTNGTRPGGSARAAGRAAALALLACACGPVAPTAGDGPAPRVAGTVDREVGPAPLRACFDAHTSAVAGGGPIAIVWDLGDGSPRAAGPVACHTYAEPGSYAASVEVTDARGRSEMAVVVVTATAP